ncbi:hypothetical protein [Streptomyces sp. NRRL S-350]|uniref:hypothetical protein n=1 Tax=Streptomyces sp. NRRL S-350 TaxID=1463902 RepID=UPI0004C1ABB2|nr:hypothetical protein [Streptomyces sp. NRRL S-350]
MTDDTPARPTLDTLLANAALPLERVLRRFNIEAERHIRARVTYRDTHAYATALWEAATAAKAALDYRSGGAITECAALLFADGPLDLAVDQLAALAGRIDHAPEQGATYAEWARWHLEAADSYLSHYS